MNLFQPFTYKVLENNFLDFDTTNKSEIVATSILIFFNLLALLLSIINFQRITLWYFYHNNVSPNKLICINVNIFLAISSIEIIQLLLVTK